MSNDPLKETSGPPAPPLFEGLLSEGLLSDSLVARYLERIGYTGECAPSFEVLEALQRAHMTAVPFENLFVEARVGVRTDLDWSLPKILDDRRGGWCFEVNGAFSALLRTLGFDVKLLGAAVLLGGPNQFIDHLTLEVQLEEPWLVDVGFGEGFIVPLALNRRGPQEGGDGRYEFLASPEGTTLAKITEGVPTAHYRFKRVAHELHEFDAASYRLQTDPSSMFTQKRFATRLLGNGADRVSLLRDRLNIQRDGQTTVEDVSPEHWPHVLEQWFAMTPPLPAEG